MQHDDVLGSGEMDRRVFTLEAVNALLPKLHDLVGRQLERRSGIEQLLARLGRELGDVPDRIVLDPADPHDVREMKRELVRRIVREAQQALTRGGLLVD